MVYWITKRIGTKAADEDLTPSEYGSLIIDLRNIADSGENSEMNIQFTVSKILNILAIGKFPIVLQCQAGISRSNAIATLLLVYATGMLWEDAIEIVKKKCPRANINQDLLDLLKRMFPDDRV